jgi:hypothetical protein
MAECRDVTLVVEAGKVAEFRAATGLPRDDAARFAPPTFPVVVEHAGAVFADLLVDRGVDLGRVLHGEECIEYPGGPLRVGEQLHGQMWIAGEESREGSEGSLRLVSVRMELLRADGSTAVTVDRVLVVLGTIRSLAEPPRPPYRSR